MNKELWKEFIEGKKQVHCDNKEESRELEKLLHSKGFKFDYRLNPDEFKYGYLGQTVYVIRNSKMYIIYKVNVEKTITYKELMQEEANADNVVFKDLQETGTKASNALRSVINKLSTNDTKDFKEFENAMNETNKMIESEEYKEFLEECKKYSECIPFGFCGNLDTQNCRCDIESVNHPTHYNNGIEAIEYIESHNFNFNLGNAVKYITRCEYKENKKEDIEKAIWYLQREIDKL